MKLAEPKDPRTIPLPLLIDDTGLAQRVQTATTAADAWRLLSDTPADPATLERLSAAALDCCAASDAIGRGLVAFATLPPDAEIPDGWVDRMVELYRAYLEGYWALDDLAYEGAKAGGWTVSTRETLVDDPAGRIAQRARWVAEECPVAKPALWRDKLTHALGEIAELASGGGTLMTPEDVRTAGHALVAAAVHHRYSGWQKARLEANRPDGAAVPGTPAGRAAPARDGGVA